MEITCADCGCLVDRGVVQKPCSEYPACCCGVLPMHEAVDDHIGSDSMKTALVRLRWLVVGGAVAMNDRPALACHP